MATATQSSTTIKKSMRGKSMNAPLEDRSRMIAEAAYYLAEQRDFSGGDPVKDWLDAEALIDQMVRKAKRKPRTQ